MADEIEVVEIWRKTKDGEDTFWLVCMDGYAHQFVSGETKLRLLLTDGSPCPRCGGRGQVYYPGEHVVDCELCTALIDGVDDNG